MAEFGISVREILKRTVIVEAESVAAAIERDEILLDVGSCEHAFNQDGVKGVN